MMFFDDGHGWTLMRYLPTHLFTKKKEKKSIMYLFSIFVISLTSPDQTGFIIISNVLSIICYGQSKRKWIFSSQKSDALYFIEIYI